MKKFLLIAGAGYYPQSGTDDWIGCFNTYEEAKSKVSVKETHEYFSRGPRKGEIKETRKHYEIDGGEVDWYEIVDLEEWMNK
jgi:hypothetical protein